MIRKIIFIGVIFTIAACSGKKKQRDIRKLSWYEIHADAKGKELKILIPDLVYLQRQTETAAIRAELQAKTGIHVVWIPCKKSALIDSLRSSTRASLIELDGETLGEAVKNQYLLGPIETKIPSAKSYQTESDSFRASHGVSAQGHAVPCVACAKDSTLEHPFWAIPMDAESQAAAIVFLDYILASRAGRE